MRTVTIVLSHSVYWRIHRKDPRLYNFKFLDRFCVINPLLYPRIVSEPHQAFFRIRGIKGDEVLIETNIFIVASKIDGNPEDLSTMSMIVWDSNTDELYIQPLLDEKGKDGVHLLYLLKSLRYAANDVFLRPRPQYLANVYVKTLPKLVFPAVSIPDNSFVWRQDWETAIRWNSLKLLDTYLVKGDYEPSVYHVIMMDAFRSYYQEDYRSALLYAAIAIETASRIVLDEVYQLQTKGKKKKADLRITLFPLPRGEFAIKDPVYEKLIDKTDFSPLLHEVPLYLLGKSLLVEQQELYRRAVKLYATRNKIVHQGSPPADNKVYQLNKNDVETALECAISVMKWFGLSYKYPSFDYEEMYLDQVEPSPLFTLK